MIKGIKTVDEYIKAAPGEAQAKLVQLRQLIKEAAPDAEERISYQMPYYDYHGRLIYFAGYKEHIGLYVMSDASEALKKEIEKYHSGKATLRFPVKEPLPAALIKKIVRIQAAANKSK